MMKTLPEVERTLTQQKPYLHQKYGVKQLGIFGSYVRHEQRPESDLDILVELERPVQIGLIGLVELEHYLTDLLGVKVDVAIKENLKRRIGQRILSEVTML